MDLLSPDSLHSCPEIKEHPETGVYVKVGMKKMSCFPTDPSNLMRLQVFFSR